MNLKINVKTIIVTLGLLGAVMAVSANAEPEIYRIITNYPNPFDSRLGNTTILYTLGTDCAVKTKIYDMFGNLVRDYHERSEVAGVKRIIWDGTDEMGSKVAKGGYICVVEIRNNESKVLATRKIGVVH
jgi:hypothetical protein